MQLLPWHQLSSDAILSRSEQDPSDKASSEKNFKLRQSVSQWNLLHHANVCKYCLGSASEQALRCPGSVLRCSGENVEVAQRTFKSSTSSNNTVKVFKANVLKTNTI